MRRKKNMTYSAIKWHEINSLSLNIGIKIKEVSGVINCVIYIAYSSVAYLTAGNISLFVLLLDRSLLLMHDHLCKNLLQETEEEHIGRFLSDNLTKLTQQTEFRYIAVVLPLREFIKYWGCFFSLNRARRSTNRWKPSASHSCLET